MVTRSVWGRSSSPSLQQDNEQLLVPLPSDGRRRFAKHQNIFLLAEEALFTKKVMDIKTMTLFRTQGMLRAQFSSSNKLLHIERIYDV